MRSVIPQRQAPRITGKVTFILFGDGTRGIDSYMTLLALTYHIPNT